MWLSSASQQPSGCLVEPAAAPGNDEAGLSTESAVTHGPFPV